MRAHLGGANEGGEGVDERLHLRDARTKHKHNTAAACQRSRKGELRAERGVVVVLAVRGEGRDGKESEARRRGEIEASYRREEEKRGAKKGEKRGEKSGGERQSGTGE